MFAVASPDIKIDLLVDGKAVIRIQNDQLTTSVIRIKENSKVEIQVVASKIVALETFIELKKL